MIQMPDENTNIPQRRGDTIPLSPEEKRTVIARMNALTGRPHDFVTEIARQATDARGRLDDDVYGIVRVTLKALAENHGQPPPNELPLRVEPMPDRERVIKHANASGIKRYSPGELKLLAAEGRLKGNGVGVLTSLPRPQNSGDTPVCPSVFARNASRQACWTDPARRLDTIGFETRVDAVGNLIADLPATSDVAPNLMFTAHMDCAYPGGDAPVNPILYRSGDIGTDGRNSLGADDKSGIAGILTATEYITDAKLPHGEIRVVFTVQEELGWRGIKQIPANILNGIHLVFAMDVPVRVERDETSFMAVLNLTPGPPFAKLARNSARKIGGKPLIL